ncbi:MAG: primase 1D-like protein [Sulfuricella sp.]
MSPTVDPRWVGHRLISGYAALRWTKNTEQYLNTPTLIETNCSANI